MYKEEVIRKTFKENKNMDCFQMAAEYAVGGKRYLFSHAGVHPEWLKRHSDLFGQVEKMTAETFIRQMFTDDFVDALSDVSFLRGGRCNVGSMIWADIDEFAGNEASASERIQICGHTRCSDGQPKAFGNVICTDCQRAFVITLKNNSLASENLTNNFLSLQPNSNRNPDGLQNQRFEL